MTLNNSFTAVLERNTTFDGDFVTEPYEAAWAREARFFVRVLGSQGEPVLTARTQVSPDGLHWCDLDGQEHRIDPDGTELHTWAAREFGGWLRIKGSVAPRSAGLEAGGSVTALVYLALKA